MIGGQNGLLLPAPGMFAGAEAKDGRFESSLVRSMGNPFQGAIGFLRPSLSSREKIERPYEENVWVRAGLKAFSEAFARLPFEVWNGNPKDDASRVLESHPLLDLLRSPNPLQTQAEFFAAHAINLKLDGETFWFLANAQGDPVAVTGTTGQGPTEFITEIPAMIIQARGSIVEHSTNANGVPISYRFSIDASGRQDQGANWSPEYPAGAVIPFIDYDPNHMVRGLGDVQAVMRELGLYFQTQRYLDGVVRNGGDPGAWIVFEHKTSPGERERRQVELDDETGVKDVSRYKILETGAKVIPNPVGPKDMEYRSLLEWLRDSILAAIGVPPPMVGVFDDATYNNIQTAERIMWTGPNGILSAVRKTADVVTFKLLSRLRSGSTGQTLFAKFNTEDVEVLKKDRTPQITLAKDVAAAGIGLSVEQALALQGVEFDPLDDGAGEQGFVHTTLRPADQVLDDGDESNAVQEAALNGAQIAELIAIVEKVGTGLIPKDAAVELIVASFPLDRTRAGKILESVQEGSVEPTPQAGDGAVSEGEPDALDEPAASDDEPPAEEPPVESKALPSASTRGLKLGKPIEPDKRLTAKIVAWLADYEKATLELWQRVANDRIHISDEAFNILTLNQAEWEELFSLSTDETIESIFGDALGVARNAWGGPFITTSDPRVVSFLANQRILLSSITRTTTDRVKNLLLRNFAGLDSDLLPVEQLVSDALPDLTDELKRVFGTKEARANAISRTETGRAQNGANYMQMRDAGVATVRWVTAGDGVVRDTHQLQEGMVRNMDEQFPNGLLHPHDPAGAAAEVVNCRCSVVAESFKEDEA